MPSLRLSRPLLHPYFILSQPVIRPLKEVPELFGHRFREDVPPISTKYAGGLLA
jgi:hypothetical protein